jgi:hypothetical protein
MSTKASMSQESIEEIVLLRLHWKFSNISNLKQLVSCNSEFKPNGEETSSKLICKFRNTLMLSLIIFLLVVKVYDLEIKEPLVTGR